MRRNLRSFESLHRVGGEEFLLLLPGVDLDEAIRIAERIRHGIEQARPAGLDIAASLGIAIADAGDSGPLEQMIGEADLALYRAKDLGRNRTEWGAGSRSSRPERRARAIGLTRRLQVALPEDPARTASSSAQ